MKKIEIPTNVVSGKLVQNRRLIENAIKEFEGKNINLTLKLRSKKRSESQNDFYWGIWIPILQQAFKDTQGEFYTPEKVHEFLKTNFNYEEKPNPQTGEMLRFIKSSTELTTYEWETEFKTQIRQFAMDFFNIDLPEPDPEKKNSK